MDITLGNVGSMTQYVEPSLWVTATIKAGKKSKQISICRWYDYILYIIRKYNLLQHKCYIQADKLDDCMVLKVLIFFQLKKNYKTLKLTRDWKEQKQYGAPAMISNKRVN